MEKNKLIRLSKIGDYDKGGLKMVDIECLIRSLLGNGTFLTSQQSLVDYFYFIKIMIPLTSQFLVNSTITFCNGESGFRQDFETSKDWKRIICR